MEYKYVKGIKVDKMSVVSKIKHHVKEPAPYPRVSDGYENLSQAIFATQINNMFTELTEEMVSMKDK